MAGKHRGQSDVAPDGTPMANKEDMQKEFDKSYEDSKESASYPTIGRTTVRWGGKGK